MDTFWAESFWLPKGYTWKDMANKPGSNIYLPQATDLNWSVPLGLLLLIFRYFIEKFIVTPLGWKLGVKQKKMPVLKPNPVLEDTFKKNGMVSKTQLEAVAKRTDMKIRDVERWLRDRQKLAMPSDIQKFRECSWHFIFYLTSFTYGLVVLWDKPWFWETKFCWKNWPSLDVSNDVYVYYLTELSFYWCLVFSILTDHKRKDFNQMIIHHIATILLIYFSWSNNFVRIGTLVLIAHDAADIPMALGKMMKYSGHPLLTDLLLYLFIVVWILSRLAYYPFIVVVSASVEVYEYLPPFPSFYFFNGLLIVLLILHLIWTYMIARIAVIKFSKGEVSDVRSDESD